MAPVQKQGNNKRTYTDSDGKKLNDYIPNYISNAPWYVSDAPLAIDSNSRKRKNDDVIIKELKESGSNRLKHQRLDPLIESTPNNEPRKGKGINDNFVIVNNDNDDNQDPHQTQKIKQPVLDSKSIKHQREIWKKKIKDWKKKGKCENCGGNHHKSDCLEKPHSENYLIYKQQDKNLNNSILIRADNNDWDTKRDRWHGFNAETEYAQILQGLEKKEKNKVLAYMNKNKNDLNKELDTDDLIKAILQDNPLAKKSNDEHVGRSLDQKPRYLEVIKTGEELRYNPKSRVYKDLNEGYLNDRGQFIPYLTGEAAEFEKLKKFTRTIQNEQHVKWEDDESGAISAADKQFNLEFNPTAVMVKMKEKEENDKKIRDIKRKQLLEKYGDVEDDNSI